MLRVCSRPEGPEVTEEVTDRGGEEDLPEGAGRQGEEGVWQDGGRHSRFPGQAGQAGEARQEVVPIDPTENGPEKFGPVLPFAGGGR